MDKSKNELTHEQIEKIGALKDQIASTTTLASRMKASQNALRASKAWIEKGKIVLLLPEEVELCFPARLLHSLQGLSDEELLKMRLVSGGQTLVWLEKGISINVQGMVEAVTKSPSMKSIASKGGKSKSKAKSDAARTNGTSGGRPKKIAA